MITRLAIKNFALIEDTEVFFDSGLNIITGETGAGKSIFIGAIGLLLGKKAEASAFLFPDQKSVIEATFEVQSHVFSEELLQNEELDLSDTELIIRREVMPNGKSRAFVNDSPVNLQMLRNIMDCVLDLHGQHDGQQLLSADYQLFVLDQFANTSNLVQEYKIIWKNYNQAHNQLKKLQDLAQSASQEEEFLKFQADELKSAKLSVLEENTLEEELQILENAEAIREALELACDKLYENERSVVSIMSSVMKPLSKVSDYDKIIAAELEKLEEYVDLVKDSSSILRDRADQIETDPDRFQVVQDRLNVYNRLKMKYKTNETADLLQMLKQIQGKLNQITHAGEEIEQLQVKIHEFLTELTEKGKQLSSLRSAAASELEPLVKSMLEQVGLANAVFQVQHQISDKANAKGFDQIKFLVSTNPGMPMGSLEQVASGGEISRFMLAIKAALAEKASLSTLIFDEIDTGISGEVALKVGKVMEQIASKIQLVTITHLPQIASRNGSHYFIFKEIISEQTFSRIKKLENSERVQELAVMLSGANPPASAIENAKEMLGMK